MKCTKCKEIDVVWDDRVVRMNPAGKTIYDYSVGHCPECNIKYELDNLGTKGKPKESDLGIGSFILSISGILAPIGVIMALIDLSKGKSSENHTYAALALMIGIGMIIILSMLIWG